MGAVTVTAALFSLAQFGLVELGAFSVPVLVVFLAGAFAIFYAWQESKRYYPVGGDRAIARADRSAHAVAVGDGRGRASDPEPDQRV